MLFSIAPKKKKDDLFNREIEYSKLQKDVQTGRIILLDGLRRIGKTSLLKAFLNESDHFSIMIDCRAFEKNHGINKREFNKAISEEIDKQIRTSKFKKLLQNISEFGLGDITIRLNNKIYDSKPNISKILSELNAMLEKKEKKFIIAFDEAQFLRFYGKGGHELLQMMAYVYDNLENILFVLTGSEVGLLHDFLSVENPDAPLYGRYINEITLKRFEKAKSMEFLKRGFAENEIKISEDEASRVVEKLDGIVGYLTMFGYSAITEDNFDLQSNLIRTSEMAGKIVKKEINALIAKSPNYGYVLNAIAYGMDRYSKVKKYVENNFAEISDTTLSKILLTLKKQSFINFKYYKSHKFYYFPDPIIAFVCQDIV